MKLNIKHLHAFYDVAQLGSISAATHSVHMSQPAVSHAIAQIERYFCARLFTRTTLGMQLTSAGRVCAERTGRALTALHEGIVTLRAVAHGESGAGERIALGMRMAHLRALTALAQNRNFTLAARACHMAQPTIHRAARALERLLEVPLFEKTSYGIGPTSGAEYLARCAGVALAELEQARAEVTALSGKEGGRTVIGAMPMAHPFLVPDVLVEFSLKCPEHGIAIISGTYEHLLAALQIGEADFLVGPLRSSSSPRDVIQEHLFEESLSIIVRADHPLARRRRVTGRDLSSFPWIAPRKGAPLRSDFDALFEFAGVDAPQRPVECHSLSFARAFLLASDRLMLLSPHQFRDELRAGTLVALAHPAGRILRPIGLTFRRSWWPTSTQTNLLDLIRQRSRIVECTAPGNRDHLPLAKDPDQPSFSLPSQVLAGQVA